MIRIDGFYLYTVGYSIHPISGLTAEAPFNDWIFHLFTAQGSLESFLDQSVFQVTASRTSGLKLLRAIKALTVDFQRTAPIDFMEAYNVTSSLLEFEHVLTAEFGMMSVYLVLKKRGYDTTDLIQNGRVLFPPELGTKVPEAIADVNVATKCIAYELHTAAGFHLHRANESVVHRYYDSVTQGAPRPGGRNLGDYLASLRDNNKGDAKVISALKDLKDLHRNPLIHPEHSLEDVDEVIALLGGVQTAVTMMLKAIPNPTPPPQVLPPAQ